MASQKENQPDNRQGAKVPRIQVVNILLLFLGMAIAIIGIIALLRLLEARSITAEARDRYEESEAAATSLMEASDYLTTQAKMCVLTGDESYLWKYLDELNQTRRRDQAVATLRKHSQGSTAHKKLDKALQSSNSLSKRELYAMRLVAEAEKFTDLPDTISNINLSEKDKALTDEQKSERAKDLMLGHEYDEMKAPIVASVDECTNALSEDLMNDRSKSYAVEKQQQAILLCALIAEIALLATAATCMHVFMIKPMRMHERSIQNNEPLEICGSAEIRSVAASYNKLYNENLRRTKLLRHQAESDGLTGLLNRGSFDRVLAHHGEDVGLIIVDVDLFKRINDENGHEVGDEVLKKVGKSLQNRFRNTDYVCRIGGDEFAVVLTEMRSELRSVVISKVKMITNDVSDTSDGLPVVTLSFGIAFSVSLPDGMSLYHAADKALYEAKHNGRNGYVFFEASM